MTDSTVETLNAISGAGGLASPDLFYVFRPGTPDADFKADAGSVLTYVEGAATAFAHTVHTHTLSAITDAGTLAAKSSIDLSTGDATGILAAARFPALSGDVTTAPGALAATIADNAVTNAKAAPMPAATLKGNNTGATANAADLTAAQATAMLETLAGDSGSGGVKGLAPAPAAGDAAAGKYLRADGIWAVPAGAGGSPGGSGGQIQYNDAGSFGGAANLSVDGGGNAVLGEYASSTPSAPGAGATLFGRNRAGRTLPAFINGQNRWSDVFPVPAGHVVWSSAYGIGNALVNNTGGNGLITSTGTATAKTFDGTTFGGSIANTLNVTAASTGSSAGYTVNAGPAAAVFRGTVAGTGGFEARFRFGLDTIAGGQSWFVGFTGGIPDIGNVDPSSLADIIGIGCDAGQTTARFIHNDGTGSATAVDLGADFPAATSGVYYEARFFCAPNGTTFHYSLERLDTPQLTEGSAATDIPGATTLLYPQIHICTRAVAAAAKISFSKYLLMQDF